MDYQFLIFIIAMFTPLAIAITFLIKFLISVISDDNPLSRHSHVNPIILNIPKRFHDNKVYDDKVYDKSKIIR